MTEPVNPRRAYNSEGRRRRAAATRTAVLDVAHRAFLERGYAEVSIPAVAEAAGVSAELIYKAFGAKPQLLKAVFDRSVVGDERPVAVMDRPDVQRLAAMTDSGEVLDGYAGFAAGVQRRVAPVYLVARDAAAADPAAAPIVAQMDTERLTGMTAPAAQLMRIGGLRPELGPDEVRDILWVLTAPEVYELFVLRRGWSEDDYVVQLRRNLRGALLG